MISRIELNNLHDHNINIATREIWLHPLINEGDLSQAEVDYRMAVIFEKNLRLLDRQNDKPILIHQHTCGGSWNDGMAIYDTIKSSRCFITILVYAHARSMSSIFLQAADRRIMMPNAYFLAHYGMDADDDRNTAYLTHAEESKRTNKVMLQIYAQVGYGSKKFKGMTREKITQFIDRQFKDNTDWILQAEEAVAYGFADGILGKGKFKTIDGLLK